MIVAFAGPSLPPSVRAGVDGVVWAPPAAQGDVFRASQNQPDAIVLIDGYFSWTPAVWHKEILWALDRGVRVYGASSMGALRAAELHPFGMQGVGEIFAAFASGELEDDDEVALVHAGAEDDYAPFSLPMVNIRASLQQAAEEGVVDAPQAQAWIGRAKALFYPERTWANIVAEIPDASAAARLSAWLAVGNEVDLKRADALAALQAALKATTAEGGRAAVQGDFHFEHTALWDALVERAAPQTLGSEVEGAVKTLSRDLIRQALDPDSAAIEERAVLRFLVADRAEVSTLDVDEIRLEAEIVAFRRRIGLQDAAGLQTWLEANDLTPRSFLALMYRNALTTEFLDRARTAATPHLLDEIRTRDVYPRAKARVAKARVAEAGVAEAAGEGWRA